ncbi:MAG: hypothetical protein WAO58_01990 [Fimbriimonadaceae bacterium]
MNARSPARTRYRILPSTRIAIGFIGISAGAYFAWNWFGSRASSERFEPIEPGRITLLGLRAGGPYKIVVQNRIAILQIVDEDDSQFGKPEEESENLERSENVQGKRRVPIRELLGTLQGDEKALSRFVTIMNDVQDVDMPSVLVYWEADDIKKALDGDKVLRTKLEDAIGMDLDGRPLGKLKVGSLLNGIVIKVPVKVDVPVGGQIRTMTGYVDKPFRSQFSREIERFLQEKGMRGDDRAALRAAIVQKAADIGKGRGEDISGALRRIIDENAAQGYAAPVKKVLGRAFVVLNDKFMEGADLTGYDSSDGKKYFTLRLQLSDEGTRRLWKYSREHIGNQLLLVKDGVAIAAPMIKHELRDGNVDVTQLQEETLAQETADLLNQLNQDRK